MNRPLLIMYLEERINHDMSVMGELSFRLIAFKESDCIFQVFYLNSNKLPF